MTYPAPRTLLEQALVSDPSSIMVLRKILIEAVNAADKWGHDRPSAAPCATYIMAALVPAITELDAWTRSLAEPKPAATPEPASNVGYL